MNILKESFYAFLLMLGAGILVVLLKYCYQFSAPAQLLVWSLFTVSVFASLHIWVRVGKKARAKRDTLIIFAIGLTAFFLVLEGIVGWLLSSAFLAGLWILFILYAYLYFYWAVMRVRPKREYEKWNKSKIIRELKRYSRTHQTIRKRDVPQKLYLASIRYFGSWEKAKKEAGVR